MSDIALWHLKTRPNRNSLHRPPAPIAPTPLGRQLCNLSVFYDTINGSNRAIPRALFLSDRFKKSATVSPRAAPQIRRSLVASIYQMQPLPSEIFLSLVRSASKWSRISCESRCMREEAPRRRRRSLNSNLHNVR
jgi:hypothetical protein